MIVQGRLKVRTETREGQPDWMSADIDAVSVGHDLARGTTAFRRTPRAELNPASDRSEPAWETDPAPSPPADGAATDVDSDETSQLRPEAAMVT